MANTTITTNLGMVLPVPTVRLGPAWATDLNAALEVIDSHDHSSGKGARVPTSGLNINADLEFNSNKACNLSQTQYVSQPSILTGGSNGNSVFTYLGNLYFTNESGTPVQITSGGSIVAPPGSAQIFEYQPIASNTTIAPAATFVYLAIDTTAARTITLPLASSVSAGRIYILKDVSGEANSNNITIATQGSDTVDNSSSAIMDSNLGSVTIIGDGADSWYIS